MGLKSKIANRILNSKLESVVREKKVFNLDSAQSAGILWTFDQKKSFDLLETELRKAGIKPTGMCYFQMKKTLIPLDVNGFSRRQTSCWIGIPRAELAKDFIHQKFDILIDLTGQKIFSLVYISALSEAAFKIGYSENSINYNDWNIEFGEHPDTSQMTEQILYYLKRINKTTIE